MTVEGPVRSVVIVIVLPLAKLVVKQVDVVRDAALVEQLVERLVIHAVRSLDFPI